VTAREIAAAVVSDRGRAGLLVSVGILAIALVDFVSGTEIRVFPLYYGPIALAAWVFGRNAALAAALAGAIGWLLANRLAGQEYSHSAIWIVNTVVQGASFAIIGALVSYLRATLLREQGLSRIDGLSGLMNHRAFYAESERILRLCRRARRPVTLAYLDLDDFKIVNDSFGHLAGDDLLRDVAQVLQSTLRSSDLTARLGGDEFAVLLPELGSDEAGQALQRLHSSINHAARTASTIVSVTIGAVTLIAPPPEVETLVRLADAAMYAAKKEGKNRVRLEVIEPAA
jgi:diguanylate cyclase (GGDEF)-like protein